MRSKWEINKLELLKLSISHLDVRKNNTLSSLRLQDVRERFPSPRVILGDHKQNPHNWNGLLSIFDNTFSLSDRKILTNIPTIQTMLYFLSIFVNVFRNPLGKQGDQFCNSP